MNNVNSLLDKAQEVCGVKTDSGLAEKLKVPRQNVCNWRKGRNSPDIVACGKIAEITGIPLARVLGIVGEARAISREEKAVWRRLASAAMVASLVLCALPAWASIRPTLTDGGYMHYAK